MRRDEPPDLPEPDRAEGAPHPRETRRLFGQQAAEAAFLGAFNADRLHHAWLLTGLRGVGKATFAWRAARFLLAAEPAGGLFGPAPADTLDIAPDHPVARRVAALAEPRLFLLRRGANDRGTALSQVIRLEELRPLRDFLHLSAADGGRRAVIIDAADELNSAAANALLKLLEEPPPLVTFLIVAHQPARLLPTIRSRCRTLPLAPLGAGDLAAALAQAGIAADDPAALALLAGGSAGEAVRLARGDGVALYREIAELARSLPQMDRARALRLADSAAARGAEARFDLILHLTDRFLSRLARRGATGLATDEAAPDEAALFARLAPDAAAGRVWADLAQSLTERVRRGRAVNLDAPALLMDMLLKVDETAARLAARQAG
jgi:DNA polymerase-3 subunit delta'